MDAQQIEEIQNKLASVSVLPLNVFGMNVNIVEVKNGGDCYRHIRECVEKDTLVIFDYNGVIVNDQLKPNYDILKLFNELPCRKLCLSMQGVGSIPFLQDLFKSLNACEYDFSQSWNDFSFASEKPELMNPDKPQKEDNAAYKDGVIVCGVGTTKGNALSWFLERINFTPPKIFFIDDMQEFLEDIRRVCAESSTPYLGLLYNSKLDLQATHIKKIMDMVECKLCPDRKTIVALVGGLWSSKNTREQEIVDFFSELGKKKNVIRLYVTSVCRKNITDNDFHKYLELIKQAGCDFAKDWEFLFKPEALLRADEKRPDRNIMFKSGVLVGNFYNEEGACLQWFLSKLNVAEHKISPKIIFVRYVYDYKLGQIYSAVKSLNLNIEALPIVWPDITNSPRDFGDFY